MTEMKPGLLDRVIEQSALRRFRRWAETARKMDLRDLRRNRAAARRLKFFLDELLHVADDRLALPVLGNQSVPIPYDADWSWRPEVWCGPLPVQGISSVENKSMLGREVTLFHDCSQSELTLRQLRKGDPRIFGDNADWIRSEACLKLDLGKGRLPGMLIMGSEDPNLFSAQQGTDLLAFFAGVFERAMRRWLS